MADPLVTDVDLVEAAAASYVFGAVPFFEDLKHSIRVFRTLGGQDDEVFNILAIEGTHDVMGWALDFVASTVEDQQGLDHKSLGFVHAGFYTAAITALARCVLVAARGPYAICGHSLGGALALLLGAMLADDGLPPLKIGAFAPPRVGGGDFVKVATSVPFCAYRYGDDPVTEVPVGVLPWFPYQQVPLTRLPAPDIGALDLRARLACHRVENYVAGVKSVISGGGDTDSTGRGT